MSLDASEPRAVAAVEVQPSVVDALIAKLSAAVRELTAAGDPRRAAMACVELGQAYESALGNSAKVSQAA